MPILLDAARASRAPPAGRAGSRGGFVAFPGHEGLLGPRGTGGLYVRPASASLLATTRGRHRIMVGVTQPARVHARAVRVQLAAQHDRDRRAGRGGAVDPRSGGRVAPAHELALIRLMLDGLRGAGCRHPDWEVEGGGPLAAFGLLGARTVPNAGSGSLRSCTTCCPGGSSGGARSGLACLPGRGSPVPRWRRRYVRDVGGWRGVPPRRRAVRHGGPTSSGRSRPLEEWAEAAAPVMPGAGRTVA